MIFFTEEPTQGKIDPLKNELYESRRVTVRDLHIRVLKTLSTEKKKKTLL